MCILYQETR